MFTVPPGLRRSRSFAATVFLTLVPHGGQQRARRNAAAPLPPASPPDSRPTRRWALDG